MRALRADKITFAILEATLAEYAAGRAATTIPVQRMLHLSADDIEARAQALAASLAAQRLARRDDQRLVGGRRRQRAGPATADGAARRSRGTANQPDATERWLRSLDPPVIARIEHDRVVLDLRTVLPEQDATLAGLLRERT